MRFLVMVKATPESEAGQLPSREMLERMGKFNEGLVKDGIMLTGEGLQASMKGVRMKFGDGTGEPRLIDGPFTETKELVAGFWILQGRSKEEIVARMKSCPFSGGEEIEIRQIFEVEEFSCILEGRRA